jgi:endonuclease/exonuclease/phosphatase family metal-dependent hydrolase
VPLERLEAQICELARHLTAATRRFLVLLGDFDARRGWASWEMTSCPPLPQAGGTIEDWHDADITPETIIPAWYGERLDLDHAIYICFANAANAANAANQVIEPHEGMARLHGDHATN